MRSNKFAYRWRNSKFRNFLRKIKLWTKNGTKVKFILLMYALVVLIITLFLNSKITHNPSYVAENKITFWDAFFTTCSAFSNTGLVSHPTYKAWNMFGQSLIAIAALLGGFGLFALKIFLINVIFMKGHVSLSDVELVSYERGHSDFFKNKRMIIDSMIFLMVTLVLASIGLSFYFYYVAPKTELAHLREVVNNNSVNFDNPYHNWSHSFRFGIFHAISAINNAGFDIIGDNSLMPYYKNIGLQVIIMILFLIGGIGYPVIHDVVNYIRIKSINKNAYYNWSLFTKISVVTYLIVTLFGFIFVISFELSSTDSIFKSNLQYYGNNAYKTWSLLFMVISTRSAGFSTLNLHLLSEPTLWVLGTLMFIGAAPASTGGGIRTTTFAILFLLIISKVFGRPNVRAFKRQVDSDTVKMSTIVSTISVVLVGFVSLVVMSSFDNFNGLVPRSQYNATHIFFEVFSAFGTSGLTTGITSSLNVGSKIVLSVLMFIGQFGVSSSVLIWTSKKNYAYKYNYISESVTIG